MVTTQQDRVVQKIIEDYRNERDFFSDESDDDDLPVEKIMAQMEASDQFENDRERALYLTLSTSLNFMKQAITLRKRTAGLWGSDPWIYEPSTLVGDDRYYDLLDLFKGRNDFANHDVIEKYGRMEWGKKDVDIWYTVAATLYEDRDSNPLNLFEAFDNDAREIFSHVSTASRDQPAHEQIGTSKKYPYLGGEKIGPLWLRLIDDLEVHDLHNVDLLPLPVDSQVVKVTNTVFNENFSREPSDSEKEQIREIWHPFCKDHEISTAELDSALWRIGEQGNWDARGQKYLRKLME